jgi:hypothetical protein
VGRAALQVSAENDVFRATYQVTELDDQRLELKFEGSLLRDLPAEIEYAAGYFNANLLANRPFRAWTASGERRGRVAVYPSSADQVRNDLAPGFRTLELDSRLGRLRLDVECDQRVMFFDARRDGQDWARQAPVFWCGLGVPARKLRFGEPVRLTLKLSMEPGTGDEEPPRELSVRPRLTTVRDQPRPDGPWEPMLIPRPRSVRPGPGKLDWGDRPRITVRAGSGSAELRDELLEMLQDHGLQPGAVSLEAPPEGEPVGVVIRPGATGSKVAGAPSLPMPDNPEGYVLEVAAGEIRIHGRTPRGVFYGVQTLRQWLEPPDVNRPGLRAREVAISDWPAMAFRGAHWFPSATGTPFHRRLIERIMARYKLNRTVIQCEAANWSCAPEIAAPNSVSKADLRGLIAACRSHFIEPIPLINTPGHAEWLFRHGKNLELAEDPRTPYAYCVRNPRSIERVKRIMAEAIELFEPRMFHLGHDEVTLRGRFPRPDCPRCANSTPEQLMLENIGLLDGWLREKGISAMVWGDMLEKSRPLRAGLPKDTVVADWHYGRDERYPTLEVLKREGLGAVACTWYEPLNVFRFAREAQRSGTMGLLQTTWCGYFPDEAVLVRDLRQFSAMILAAEYAWSGRPEEPDRLPYDAGEEFIRAYFPRAQAAEEAITVPLDDAARTHRAGWLGLGKGWDLSGLPEGRRAFGPVWFQVPRGKCAVLGGPTAPEGAVRSLTVHLNAQADRIALLNAAVWAVPPGTPVVRMTVEYANGSSAALDLVAGKDTAAWTADAPVLNAPTPWRRTSPGGTPMGIRLTRWTNPHPEREIVRVRFEPLDPEAGWALAGMTLLRATGAR